MLTFLKENKLLTLGVAALLAGLCYYVVFVAGASTPALTTASTTGDSPNSQQLLVTLSSLRTIKLDNAIFGDPAFVSLTDFGVVIQKQPTGRQNPFLPLTGAVAQSGQQVAPVLLPPVTHKK